MDEIFLVDKNSDSKEFYKYSGRIISKQSYTISATFRIKAQNLAITHLGLVDIFQLRDRFEGQAYMNNLLLKLCSLNILEQINSIRLIDWENIPSNKTDNLLLTEFENQTYQIIPFYDGSLPIVANEVKHPLLFCAIRKDFSKGIFYGSLENFSFADRTQFLPTIEIGKRKFSKFIGFTQLVL